MSEQNAGNGELRPHKWIKSTLGHGESMCEYCKGTNRELAVLGELDHCDKAPNTRAPSVGAGDFVLVPVRKDQLEQLERLVYTKECGTAWGLVKSMLSASAPTAPGREEALDSKNPADDEAMAWVFSNLMALRRDSGSLHYTLTQAVRAYQAGKAFGLASAHTAQGLVKALEVKRPDWAYIYRDCAHTDDGDQHLVAITREAARLARSALQELNAHTYYHNYGAAQSELADVLRSHGKATP